LTWTSTNATSCKGVGTAVSGTMSMSPSATTSYTQTCTGSGGSAVASATVTVAASVTPPVTPPIEGSNCNQQLGGTPVTFCDTFDAPAGIGNGNRAGQLNGNVWGASRETMNVNLGQGEYNMWNATVIQNCDGTTPTVLPPNDIIICNGQLREASNDNNTLTFEDGVVTSLAMYPKQPFDFAGRTGTVSFDVSNDTSGTHGSWPEFWMSDAPVPDPFTHFGGWESWPANGFAVRFAAAAEVGSYGSCPNGNNLNSVRFTVDSAAVIRNYVLEDTDGFGVRTGTTVTPLDCVIESSGPGGGMNHIELRMSQNQIDVYATDAGVEATPATLRHIAVITNANLTLSRGLIWLEDVHYNADKALISRPSQRQHTFAWDNVAFDGPFVGRDFAYDAPDNTLPGLNGAQNLGKFSPANQTSTWNVPGLPANPQPAAVKVTFDFNEEVNTNPTALNVIVNGHAHSVPWPYPDQMENIWRALAVVVPVTDLVPGTNVVQLGANSPEVFSNVDIVLADVPGGVPVLPGANDSYPASQ
ncbi:MAG TPA: hypothetical protein VK727_17285, partial [Steroidobacteraceae bacterium]|nr:hypothetical protein [Steroidobacteraceae bacterium]